MIIAKRGLTWRGKILNLKLNHLQANRRTFGEHGINAKQRYTPVRKSDQNLVADGVLRDMKHRRDALELDQFADAAVLEKPKHATRAGQDGDDSARLQWSE